MGVWLVDNKRERSGMKKQYLQMIRKILVSDAYLDRLKDFHKDYQNVKCEGRYRDALLEEFNKQHLKIDNEGNAKGLVAYAEVKKVDLVICDLTSRERFHVEFKYQYTFDMAHKVAGQMDEWGFDGILEHARMTSEQRPRRYEAEQIVQDCDHKKNKKTCDAFILVVQDRTGHKQERRLLPGGVEANFIQEQYRMDQMPKNAWLSATNELLGHICDKIGGKQLRTIKHEVGHANAPLTSHIFMLDMADRLPLNVA
jgi:hypothetical protein